jgi:hypothetical protein
MGRECSMHEMHLKHAYRKRALLPFYVFTFFKCFDETVQEVGDRGTNPSPLF